MSQKLGKQAKSLLILDLNGVLGYMTKDITKFGNQGIYREGDLEAKPVYLENNVAIY